MKGLAIWKKESARAKSRAELFEELMLPHLNAAHNLARWLTGDSASAQDVVQEAYLRAFRFFDSYRGGDGKAWLLEIVRNTSHTLRRREVRHAGAPFEEAAHSAIAPQPSQEETAARGQMMDVLRRCLENLAFEFREVLVMRELEEMSYREISEATGLAAGTVMSRLSRARKRLEDCASKRAAEAAT
jgi:RNA polymerase sigma-70 factor (ECF subfamily)